MNLDTTEFSTLLRQKLQKRQEEWKNAGRVLSVKDGILTISGLEDVSSMEIVKTDSGCTAVVFNLEYDVVKAIILNDIPVQEKDLVYGTGEIIKMPVGKFWGRTLDAMGNPIDDLEDLQVEDFWPIEQSPTPIVSRESVNIPLQTGITVVDALIPIGRGQRQMIVGDRRSGKTSIALETIIQQKHTHKTNHPVFCIYVSIGQKNSTVARTVQYLKDHDAMKYTVIVHTSAADKPIMQYIAPYSATAIAEFLRDKYAYDVLIVYDDLYQHAMAYRTISLLLRRPPGREAYPGDIFYLHSRLLERGTRQKGGGSITMLPIVETQGGDISSYVVTNIISITDGQIFLSLELFNNGIRPAVNVGLSVSRIGSTAQASQLAHASRGLKSFVAQYYETKQFAAFMSDLDNETSKILHQGDFLTSCVFVQEEGRGLLMEEQVLLLYVTRCTNFHLIPMEKFMKFKDSLLEHIRSENNSCLAAIANSTKINQNLEESIISMIENFINKEDYENY